MISLFDRLAIVSSVGSFESVSPREIFDGVAVLGTASEVTFACEWA